MFFMGNYNCYLPDLRQGTTAWHSDLFCHFPEATSECSHKSLLQIKTNRKEGMRKQPAKTIEVGGAPNQRRDKSHSKSQHETHTYRCGD